MCKNNEEEEEGEENEVRQDSPGMNPWAFWNLRKRL